jgi:oxazoline/thiazoline dehydrogenase
MKNFFSLSFRSDITLSIEPERVLLRSPQHSLTLEHPKPGLKTALEHLKHSAITLLELIAVVAELDGIDDSVIFETELHKLIQLGWICHSVLPLATAIPIAENYQFNPANIVETFHETSLQPFALSRFAFLHQDDRQFVLESPLSKSKIVLLDWRVAGLIAKLGQSNSDLTIDTFVDTGLDSESIEKLLALFIATGMIVVAPEDSTVSQWKFHNLLFHCQTRKRLDNSGKSTIPIFKERDRYPIVKPPMSDRVIPLDKPDLVTLAKTDVSLTQAIESRQSIREYGDRPITLSQLAEFLYRCVRVKEVYSPEPDPMCIGEATKRPYPSGGALYELEIYPVINQCTGLDSGLYHYQPLSHTLHQISGWNPEMETLVFDAWKATGQQDTAQVLLIVTARFGRLFWKYHDIGYGLILKHIGVLYQTFYLVATAMQLAPSAIGAGNSEQFGKVANLNEYEESSVGEFVLGSLKR